MKNKDYINLERTYFMTALITGASSGIGMEIAKILASKYNIYVIITGRNEKNLINLCNEIGIEKCRYFIADLSDKNECCDLYENVKKYNIDILVNNAGFGIFGEFSDTSLDSELEMINVNISAVHILTKLFLKDFIKKNTGYILNIASSAGFMPGPMMSTYYATKNYVVRLSEAIHEELAAKKRNIYIGAFCPGPVRTDFNKRAGIISSSSKSITAKYAALYAIENMFKKKMIIIPTFYMNFMVFGSRFVSDKILLKCVSHFQSNKQI